MTNPYLINIVIWRHEISNLIEHVQGKSKEGLNHPLISVFSDLLPFISSVSESFLENTSEMASDVQLYELVKNSSY